MAITLRKIVTRFGFQADKAQLAGVVAGVEKAKDKLQQADKAADRFRASLGGLATTVKVGAAALLARVGVQGLIGDFTAAADVAAKQSAAMGVTVETYQRLRHAAELSGTSMAALQPAMAKLGKSAFDAARGAQTQAEAFRALGIKAKDSAGNLKSQDALLLELADRFKAMPDGVEKSSLAMQLMGESGAKLIPLLNAGADGIAAMGDEAAALGIVLDRAALKSAEDYNDAMTRLKGVLTGLRNQIALQLIPWITRAMERFTRWYRTGDHAARTLQALETAAKVAAVALAGVVALKVQAGFVRTVDLIVKATRAMRAFGTAGLVATAKWVAILLLVVLVLEDLVGFAQGKDSLIGRMLGEDGELDELRTSLLNTGAMLKKVWAELGPALKQAFAGLLRVFPYIVKGIAWAIVGIAKLVEYFVLGLMVIGNALGVAAAAVYVWVSDAWAWFTELVGKIRQAWSDAVDWIGEKLASIWAVFVAVGEKLAGWWTGLAGLGKASLQKVVDLFRSAGELIKAAWQSVGDFIGGIIDGVAEAASGIADKVTEGIEWMLEKLRSIIRSLPDAIKEALPDSVVEFAAAPDTGSRAATAAFASRVFGPADGASAAVGAASAAGRGRGNVSQALSVGELKVEVQGSADMGAPAMQQAVKDGARQALDDVLRNTFWNFDAGEAA